MIRPLHNNVIVELLKPARKWLVQLSTWNNETLLGRVLSVGPGKVNKKGVLIPVGVSPGDVVAFNRYYASHQTGQKVKEVLQRELGDNKGSLKGEDILFVVDGDKLPDVD